VTTEVKLVFTQDVLHSRAGGIRTSGIISRHARRCCDILLAFVAKKHPVYLSGLQRLEPDLVFVFTSTLSRNLGICVEIILENSLQNFCEIVLCIPTTQTVAFEEDRDYKLPF
jgi:hypothetical protein